jgi:hypothetical protein
MLCRSQAATAVCVPGDARSMIVSRRADRTIAEDARLAHDVRYARLGAAASAGGARVPSRRFAAPRQALTPPPPPPPPPQPPKQHRRPRRGAGVAVTFPMVTKSPKETPAREMAAAAAAAKRAPLAAASPGDQVLQVRLLCSLLSSLFCTQNSYHLLPLILPPFCTCNESLQVLTTLNSPFLLLKRKQPFEILIVHLFKRILRSLTIKNFRI